jgi:hypothetical protein
VRNDARPRPQSKSRRRFFSDDRGAVAIIMGLVLPVLIGMVGLAVEVGSWFGERRSLQSAADAAALAGAWDLLSGSNETVTTSATTYATRNGFSTSSGTITVNTPPSSGSYTTDATAVEVILTRTQSLLFSALFLGSNITISARAVANAQDLGDACVIALDSSTSGAMSVGGSSSVNLSGCGIAVNSSNSSGLTVTGSADLTTDFVRVVGNYSVGNNATLTSTQSPQTGATATADPHADLEVGAVGSCDESNYSSQANSSATINPGVYCSGLRISANSTVTMNPGTYYVNGGSFNVNGSATLTGTGVTIILTGSGNDYATVTINGGADVDLTAPTSGDYSGIVFFQDRNAPSSGVNRFNGGSTTEFTGTLYFPNQEVQFTGGNTAGGGCTRIIALQIDFNGNADLDNECDGVGVADQTASKPVLVE